MKLLLVSVKSEKSRGGIAVWTERYLSNCAEYGIDCRLVNTELIGRRARQGTAKRNATDEMRRTRRIFKDLTSVLAKENDFDIAHLNTSCGTFGLFRDYFVARAIKRRGIPLVTHFHCDIPFWIHNRLSRTVLEKLVNLSDQNWVLCENSRRYLEEQFGVKSFKIPNFIDGSLILNENKEIGDRIERVVFVGRVEQAKGATEIYVLARRFPEIVFELVGDVDDEVTDWEKPDNILLLGGKPYSQVITHLDSADVFLLPSHSEGFSVALIESMARGVPSIATDVGANADMLADGCGIIVDKGDVDAMEKALRELKSPKVREMISHRAVDKVKRLYTADSVMTLFKSRYIKSINGVQ